MKLEDFLKTKYNYDETVKDNMQTNIDQWKSWYQGNVKGFHNYFIYNGRNKVKQQRFTLNMSKEISEDWSDILWSEKCKISMKDEFISTENPNKCNACRFNDVCNQMQN